MQRFFNTLIKFNNFFVFIILLFLAILFSYNRSNYHQTKIDQIGLIISGFIYQPYQFINSYFELNIDNQKLIEENRTLKSILLNQKETEVLNGNINFLNYEIKNGKIIKNSFSKARNILIINKGELDGVKNDMAVLSHDGIIGIINKTSNNYSSVISILSRDLKINARFKNSNVFGSLEWKNLNPELMDLSDVSITNSINIGDTIVTGGMSYYFPENIILGTIKSYKESNSSGYYSIKIKLKSNLTDLNDVYILENKNREEILQLENFNIK